MGTCIHMCDTIHEDRSLIYTAGSLYKLLSELDINDISLGSYYKTIITRRQIYACMHGGN